MTDMVVQFTEEEKAALLKHLEGLSELYVAVNGSGDGPLSSFIWKIKQTGLVVEFEYLERDRILRHLGGASRYERVVYDNDSLHPILEKIKDALRPVAADPQDTFLIKKKEGGS